MSADDPFDEVHRRDEQRRYALFGVGAIVVVVVVSVVGLASLPTIADEPDTGTMTSTPYPRPYMSAAHTPAPLPPPTPVPNPTPASDLGPTPEEYPAGYVLAWGRIFVSDETGLVAPRVGDCLRPSGSWEWFGVPYVRADCSEGFLVRALSPFPDGGGVTNFADVQRLAYSTCFTPYSRGAELSSSSTHDPTSNFFHRDLVTDVGTWVVEPAPRSGEADHPVVATAVGRR